MEKLSILICSIPNPFEQKLDVCNTSIVYGEYHKALSIVEKLEFSSESKSHLVVSDSLQPHGLYSPWNSPGKNTGVGSLSLLQGIFPTQGLSLGLPHCRQFLYQLSHKGSPRILEWATYLFFNWRIINEFSKLELIKLQLKKKL